MLIVRESSGKWLMALMMSGLSLGLVQGAEPAPLVPQDVAETAWEGPASTLPMVAKGSKEQILSGKEEIISEIDQTLDDGSGKPWQDAESSDHPGWRLQVEPGTGLRWERQVQTDKQGVMHFVNRVSLPPGAPGSVTLQGYVFSALDGKVAWDGFSVTNMRLFHYPKAYQSYAIGAVTPQGIFESAGSHVRLYFYLPNWLDTSGSIQFFVPPAKNGAKGQNVLFRLQLKPPKEGNPFFTLQPGTTRQWEVRVGLFSSHGGPLSLEERDIQELAAKNYLGAFYRRELLTMGFPLPTTPSERPGHFFSMKADEKALAMIPLLAKAGTQYLVLQSPDFVDISQGVSYQGDYHQASPLLPQLVDAAHQNGMKVLEWFSIEGVLRPNAGRNGEKGSPLLLEHPDWFLPAYYWQNSYQHSDMTSPGWKQWVLDKVDYDESHYQLDGFAFDEPYFNNPKVTNGQTYVRNGYDFLQALSEKIHHYNRPQIMIGNYWAPQDDEWKFFDYMMTEQSDFMRLQAVTLGKHCAGHTFHADYFTFNIILNQLAYNLADYDQSVGWCPPSWYFYLKDAHKTQDQIAQLLSYSGAWHRVWAAEILPGLRQIELTRNNEHLILLCNVGTTPLNLVDCFPRSFQPVVPAGGGPIAWGVTDTSETHQEFEIKPVPGQAGVLPTQSLPPASITAIRFSAK